jgi:hypothetical protein
MSIYVIKAYFLTPLNMPENQRQSMKLFEKKQIQRLVGPVQPDPSPNPNRPSHTSTIFGPLKNCIGRRADGQKMFSIKAKCVLGCYCSPRERTLGNKRNELRERFTTKELVLVIGQSFILCNYEGTRQQEKKRNREHRCVQGSIIT